LVSNTLPPELPNFAVSKVGNSALLIRQCDWHSWGVEKDRGRKNPPGVRKKIRRRRRRGRRKKKRERQKRKIDRKEEEEERRIERISEASPLGNLQQESHISSRTPYMSTLDDDKRERDKEKRERELQEKKK